METQFDRKLTLQELERSDWGEPNFDSYLVTTCHRLRRKPLSEFTVEDLRIMIGQEIGLVYLIPIALEYLEADPLVEGDFYPGDLLSAVLRVGNKVFNPENSFWTGHAFYFRRTCDVVQRVKELRPSLDENDRSLVEEVLKEAATVFDAVVK